MMPDCDGGNRRAFTSGPIGRKLKDFLFWSHRAFIHFISKRGEKEGKKDMLLTHLTRRYISSLKEDDDAKSKG